MEDNKNPDQKTAAATAEKTKVAALAAKAKKEHGYKNIYATSDGYLFEHQYDAENHARTIADKTVKSY